MIKMKKKVIWINLILAVLLISTIFFALTHGASNFSMQKMTNSQLNILFNIRVPRIISALVAGASLSVSSAFFQATLRNPIAEPGIMGISSAASLCQLLAVIILPEIFFGKIIFAIIGGLLAFGLLLLFQKKMTPYQLIIIGVALNAVFTGMQEVFTNNQNSGSSLATSSWGSTMYLLVIGIIGLICAICFMNWANYLKINDEELTSLGVSAKTLRLVLMLIAVVLAATTTACIGVLAFIGIIVPQVARLLLGYDYQKIIPFSIFAGAWFLLFVDTIGRVITAPNEIAANIILAIVGGPVMILILWKRQKNA